MKNSDDPTIGFYDSDPEGYYLRTSDSDMSSERQRLVARLKPGARILDLGSGSCRDTRAFREMGFDAVPVDASAGMRDAALRHLGIDVLPLDIMDLDFDGCFDGVWASASLLHLRPEDLPKALGLIHRALVPRGAFYCSFKSGSFRGIREGRWYTDMDESALIGLLQSCGFEPADTLTESRNGYTWASAVSIRQ